MGKLQPCGHPIECIVSSDEGTHYCGWCASLEAERGQLLDREVIAAVQHGIWSHWMRYLFSVCQECTSGAFIIPVHRVERWQRQMNMLYSELSDNERESDRHQADKVAAAIRASDEKGGAATAARLSAGGRRVLSLTETSGALGRGEE